MPIYIYVCIIYNIYLLHISSSKGRHSRSLVSRAKHHFSKLVSPSREFSIWDGLWEFDVQISRILGSLLYSVMCHQMLKGLSCASLRTYQGEQGARTFSKETQQFLPCALSPLDQCVQTSPTPGQRHQPPGQDPSPKLSLQASGVKHILEVFSAHAPSIKAFPPPVASYLLVYHQLSVEHLLYFRVV